MFLKQITPRLNPSAKGRSERVQRFRYGESLTSDECLARLQEVAASKEAAKRGKGKGRGKKSSTDRKAGKSPQRPRSLLRQATTSDECFRCGQSDVTFAMHGII
ncbi:hypothetical protein RRG08_023568 [Elysia crispata]|uniref:Uncharacterized protein n=1 Tax=Elysia crispata TaxID=231223 RepID=A0AAE0Z977_9GAST|nr:hypothetical protein RRG08_023568 [Elysia crispata]